MSKHTQALLNYRSNLYNRIAIRNPQLAAQLSDIKLDWYRITNQADVEGEPSDTTEVFIYDEIGGSFGVNADDFVKELSDITSPEIDLRINSPGGSMFDSIAIYNAIVKHPSLVTTYVDALAASGASIIAMAASPYNARKKKGGVVMMDGSQLMIHDALGHEMGNARDMQAMSAFLDRQSDNIAGMYANKAGGSRKVWRDRMLAETWLFAEEAIEIGLADRVFTPPKDESDEDLDSETIEEIENALDVDIQILMHRKHDLSNRDFKYRGREAAPRPAIPNTEALVNVLQTALNRRGR